MFPYPLDHIGIAVRDLDEALYEYQKNFGAVPSHRETLTTQSVELAFIDLPNTKLELLAPQKGSAGNLARFIEQRGTGLHHICYRVTEIEGELVRLAKLGHSLIDATPRAGAHNSRIAFIHPKTMGGVLIELCEYAK